MLTQNRVRELFVYRGDGYLVRRVTRCGRALAGSVVGTDSGVGYLRTCIDNKHYLIHRIVYLWHHGYIPLHMDHINGVRNDNRIENLRPCTLNQNAWNKGRYRNSSSKYKGVSWHKRIHKWAANIRILGNNQHLGYFESEQEAAVAYNHASVKLHGDFGRRNTLD